VPSIVRFLAPNWQFLDIDINSSWANWLYIASIISEVTSTVSVFSFSKYTDMPSVFSPQIALRLSLVFCANLDTLQYAQQYFSMQDTKFSTGCHP